jgi:translation initiation factor IF-2
MTSDQTHSIVTNTSKSQVSLVLKACNKGMLEALISSIYQVAGQAGATVEIVKSDVGPITMEDIKDAEEFEAVILGMDVSVPNNVLNQAKTKKIPLKAHKIIYHLLDDVAALSKDLMAPPFSTHLMGSAEVKQVFPPSKAGAPTVAGLEVRVGLISQSLRYKVIREGQVVAENLTANSLRRHKQDVREVPKGMECGLILDNYSDFKEGDIIEGTEERKTEKQFRVEQVVVEAADVKDK